MAVQSGIILFTGKLGNVIGYTLPGSDKHFLRSMPEDVERSYATKRSAMDFGVASRGGRLLRRALSGELEIPKDGKLVNRINKALLGIVLEDENNLPGKKSILPRNLPALTGLSLNTTTGLDQLLTFRPVLTKDDAGNIRVAVKPSVKKTKNTTHIEIKAIVAGVDFAKGTHKPATSESILIDVKAAPDNVELIVPYTGKEVAFVVLQVIPFQMVNGAMSLLEDLKYLAADIIGVLRAEKDISVEVNYNSVKRSALPAHKQPGFFKGQPPPLE